MLDVNAYGRIASDIKIKQSKNKKHLYTNFLLASHQNGQTTFIRCVCFDAMASLLNSYFTKGDRIILKGDLVNDDYDNTKFAFKLKVNNFEFVETKEDHIKNKEKYIKKKNG